MVTRAERGRSRSRSRTRSRARAILRDNGLSLFFLAIFVGAILAQAFVGLAGENERLAELGRPAIAFWDFVSSSRFLVDVTENWQSEFLQFSLFIFATIWLVQRGSPESKRVGRQGLGTDREQLVGEHARPDSPRWARVGGWRTVVYSNSLLIVMFGVFALSWLAQSLGGTVVSNEHRAEIGLAPQSWGEYVISPDFWNRTLQNWQSEFLAVGAMITFAILLRQRGSAESKPVGAPHKDSAATE